MRNILLLIKTRGKTEGRPALHVMKKVCIWTGFPTAVYFTDTLMSQISLVGGSHFHSTFRTKKEDDRVPRRGGTVI